MRSNCLILGAFLLALAGCQYEPLDYSENVPDIEDAPVERDVVLDGTATITYWNGNGSARCYGVYNIVGWLEEDLGPGDTGCVGCSEDYTFAQQLEETTCADERARGAASIALMGLDFFPAENTAFDDDYDWMTSSDPMEAWRAQFNLGPVQPGHTPIENAGELLGFAVTNWTAAGPRDDGFDVVLGVFEQTDPVSDADGFWDRQLYLSHWSVYRLADPVFGLWELDLRFRD